MPSISRRIIKIEGDFTKAAVNAALEAISLRFDRLEGKSGTSSKQDPQIVLGGKGTNLTIGNFTVNRYGDDLEKVALAAGAKMDTAGQWIATQTVATIIEMSTAQNVKYYWDSGLTANVPYTPTLRSTYAL